MEQLEHTRTRGFSRRTALRTAAWAAPAITVMNAAPAFAASGPAGLLVTQVGGGTAQFATIPPANNGGGTVNTKHEPGALDIVVSGIGPNEMVSGPKVLTAIVSVPPVPGATAGDNNPHAVYFARLYGTGWSRVGTAQGNATTPTTITFLSDAAIAPGAFAPDLAFQMFSRSSSGTGATAYAFPPSTTVTVGVQAAEVPNFSGQFEVTGSDPNPPAVALAVLPITAKSFQLGVAITPFQAVAEGGTAPYGWGFSGLPAGLTGAADGTVSGTPSAEGSASVTATVTDSTSATASATFSVIVTGENDGSAAKPFTVAEAIALSNPGTSKVVRGYIVGTVASGTGANIVYKTEPPWSANTNLAIADSPTETDKTKIMTVQLPNNSIRTNWNLVTNPEKAGSRVDVTGTLVAYFLVPGINPTTAISATPV